MADNEDSITVIEIRDKLRHEFDDDVLIDAININHGNHKITVIYREHETAKKEMVEL